MWQRIRGLWRPGAFHYSAELEARRARPERKPAGVFEGWYIKLVDAQRTHPLALIPGVFLGEDAHAFIQVLDGETGEAWYHRYPIDEFQASPDRFEAHIGGSSFSSRGVALSIEPKIAGAPALRGRIDFADFAPWPVTRLSPGVMGPYGFTPFMQCYHGILSVDHGLTGELMVADRAHSFDAGRGYIEKDWGQGFPLGYVWAQSNHFEREGISLTASVATIPWVTGAFRGFLVGFLLDGELHRFTTYTGARIESLHVGEQAVELVLRDRERRLEIHAQRTSGGMLMAPYAGQMLERVAETMTSEVDVRFSEIDGGVLYEGTGNSACLEAAGELDRIVG